MDMREVLVVYQANGISYSSTFLYRSGF